MKKVSQIKNLKGKRVLVRVDFNVPIDNGKVLDDFRIRKSLPTIQFLVKKGAKVILISHLGRNPSDSLNEVSKIVNKFVKVKFVKDVVGQLAQDAVNNMKAGEVVLLDNLRSEKGEKDNDKAFARKLASLADIYVNDAFPVSHRNDASIVGVPKILPSYAGLQMENEVKNLSHVLKPQHPFVVIFGGAKTETKLPLIKKYLKEADTVFVGGALSNNFFKAEGYEVGKSVLDNGAINLKPFLKNNKLILPDTVVVARGNKKKTITITEMQSDDSILDIGIPSMRTLESVIKRAKVVLWNGPMGWYEHGYTEGTDELIKILIKAKGKVIIGGGDTSVFIERKKLGDKFTFVSTGGGATLEFLSKGTLVGIKALK
jgi:phosphoglycerate kinase